MKIIEKFKRNFEKESTFDKKVEEFNKLEILLDKEKVFNDIKNEIDARLIARAITRAAKMGLMDMVSTVSKHSDTIMKAMNKEIIKWIYKYDEENDEVVINKQYYNLLFIEKKIIRDNMVRKAMKELKPCGSYKDQLLKMINMSEEEFQDIANMMIRYKFPNDKNLANSGYIG